MTLPDITALHVAGFLFGPPLWTFLEYVLHRFAFHEAKGNNYGSREHLAHHARRDAVISFKDPDGRGLNSIVYAWMGVLFVGFVAIPLGGRVWGNAEFAAGAGPGFVAGYFFYEWIHWRAHMRPIATEYEAMIRKHHFLHHFRCPTKNHGVTTPFWDKVFGTYVTVEKVPVPRRFAMDWLLDGDGEVLPEYAGDYELRGRARLDDRQATDDHDKAFANEAPSLV